MNSIPENPHAHRASFRLDGVHDWQGYEGQTDATMQAAVIDALAEATLALAYEQRTANLIAKMSLNLQMIQTAGLTLTTTDSDWDATDDTVLARLGLDKQP